MQVLKEEVREAIIKSGMEEFYEYNYKGASVRRIAKKAGTTIGNFYNYFTSKEELFYAITDPIYEGFIYFIKSHNDNTNERNISQPIDKKDFKKEIDIIVEKYFKFFDRAFLLLIDGSNGTKYENVKEIIISFMAEHFKEHLKVIGDIDTNDIHPEFSYIVATGFLRSVIEILKSNNEDKEKMNLLSNLILIYSFSFM